ncbi:MAG TPA: thioredoxin family protein [Phycisphaerae bacterium]|nr:thioredoxin family protein [Phycisphaerae bacterium]HRY68405.1 thioredoxin family protein [Phycisphaerae bacterium]HSA27822.1 thioredoxin family protein [Phycisphaerae bacterium]
MTCQTSAIAFAVLSHDRRRAGRAGWRRLASAAGFGLMALTVLTGCSSSHMAEVKSTEQFQKQVIQAKKPVMMFFFKGGCATCMLLEPALEQMASEYGDRAIFAKYHLMSFFWIPNNSELKDRYNVVVYPTVVLFVDGQEKKRWLMHYDMKSYRKTLDEVLAARQTGAAKVTAAPARGKM